MDGGNLILITSVTRAGTGHLKRYFIGPEVINKTKNYYDTVIGTRLGLTRELGVKWFLFD